MKSLVNWGNSRDDPLIPLGVKKSDKNINTNPKGAEKVMIVEEKKVLVKAFGKSSLKLLVNNKEAKKTK